MSDARAKVLLDQLYAELPTINCKGECYDSCGPIFMSRVEWARITKRVGFEPRAGGITCPLLVNRRCHVYTIRPMICRLWGVIDKLPCPWGCRPEPRYLTSAEGYDLLLRAGLISDPDQADEIEQMRKLLRERPELVGLSEMLITPPTKTH